MALVDQSVLSADTTFQNRVRQAIIAAAIAIASESANIAWHRQRTTLSKSVMNAPDSYAPLFAKAVATDTTVQTQAGTPATQGNVTDAAINNAVSAMWNSFFSMFE